MSLFKSALRIGGLALLAAVLAVLATVALSGAASAGEYGALAAGIDGGTVGVGYSTNYANQGAADARAVEECSQRSRNCSVVSRFWNGGCGYITTATGSGTCYGFGATPATALSQCEARGCSCNAPVGGCTAR